MTTFIQYVLSPIIVAILGYITWLLQQNKKTGDANAKGTQLLLRREIIEDHRRFVINKEDLTPLAFEYITEIYQAYKGLDGNGMADKLYAEIKAVETKKGAL